jgi:predicted carbohydrate-binding protein with CBM5 and CBM33 domain
MKKKHAVRTWRLWIPKKKWNLERYLAWKSLKIYKIDENKKAELRDRPQKKYDT